MMTTMNKIKYFISLIALTMMVSLSFGQSKSVDFTTKNFTDRQGLKNALRAIDEGDAYEEIADYKTAVTNYLKAQEFNPNNADLNYKIGSCYARLNQQEAAIPYFLKRSIAFITAS